MNRECCKFTTWPKYSGHNYAVQHAVHNSNDLIKLVWFMVTFQFKLELNTEKEGFMAYTAREDAQRPRAVYAINPDFRGI